MLTIEELGEELGLSPWWAGLLVEEVSAATALRVHEAGPGSPLTAEAEAEARRRFAECPEWSAR